MDISQLGVHFIVVKNPTVSFILSLTEKNLLKIVLSHWFLYKYET